MIISNDCCSIGEVQKPDFLEKSGFLAELGFLDRRMFFELLVGFLAELKFIDRRMFFEPLVGFRNPTFPKSRVSCRS
jgi:hypothetical protein